MIDASRLSHSLATALKDRPHGIPVQPNRSLPLRPPPPPPIRISVPKSPKNSPTTQATATHQGIRKGGDASTAKDLIKKGSVRSDAVPNLRVLGMNFYDSKGEEDSPNDKFRDNDYLPNMSKGIGKSRHTKSLDNYCSDERSCEDMRRKSSDYEEVLRDFDTKKRKISSPEWTSVKSHGKTAKRDKERRAKRRKSSSGAEEDSGLSTKVKSPRVQNSDPISPAGKLKPLVLQTAEAKNSISKSRDSTDRIKGSGIGLPTIYKYRNSESTSPQWVDKNTHSKTPDCTNETSSWKQTSSNTYKLILPKPAANIPKCPVAIPIEVAHAMKEGDSKNSKSNMGLNGKHITINQNSDVVATNQSSTSIKPKTNIETGRTQVPESIEDIENAFLPSMPSLEDMMQNEGLQEKSTVHKNQTDIQSTDSNLGNELMPMVEARVLQVPADILNQTNSLNANEPVQGNMNLIHDHEFNKPHESIVNLTTVLKIQIPGRSPELIILKAPEIMASGNADGMANNSPVEATTPVSLSSAIEPALEEQKTIEEATKINMFSGLRGYRKENQWKYQKSEEEISEKTQNVQNGLSNESSSNGHQLQGEDLSEKNQPQYTLQRERHFEDTSVLSETQEPVQKHGENGLSGKIEQEISKDSQVRSKVEDIVRSRKNRYNLKLQKLYQEEAHLKCKMSQTSDPSRLTRLQQKINCAEKKIENTQKYLSKLVSIENPGLCTNSPPLRIQVRRDLVQKIPSPEALEPASQSPLRPTSEIDKASTGRSLLISSPTVITISETDSASSDSETDTSDEKSPDNVKPHLQSETEIKFHFENTTGNDTKVPFLPNNSSPDYKADNIPLNVNPEMTNNNMEYFDKNLPPVSANVNTAVVGSPRISTSPNIASIGIPQVPAGVNTASMSIPPLIPDPIDFSLGNLNGIAPQKSPSTQYGVPSLNIPPDEVINRKRSKPNCKCLPCLRSAAPATNNTVKFEANNYIPSAANDLRTPSTIRRTAIQANTNVNPVPNYPVQRADYRTTGNVPGMFSRDNGGANINLSSPLQGHSALPIPQSYYRNLTAQGYPIPTEPNSNQQTSQWHNQHPPSKSSVQFTPDLDIPSHSSILASHLLGSYSQDSANFPSSIKLSSLAQGKDATRANPAKHVNNWIMTAQFPTLGNFAAQMTRESSTNRKPANNPSVDRTRYKTTGSDMYKMAATAIDPTHVSPSSGNNTIHWAPGRPCPTEQPRPTQGYPSQRTIPPHPYRREYPPNPQIPHNPPNARAGYPGSEVFVPCSTNAYHQVPSGPQNIRSTDPSNSQPFHGQRNARQYQPQTSSTRPIAPATNYQSQRNQPQLANPMAFMPQQYLQQPPSYIQTMLSQWQSANNYHNNYIGSQYNGYNVRNKPMEQNQTVYRPVNKNHSPMQPQPQSQRMSAAGQLVQNVPNAKLPNSMYSMPANSNPVSQDGRNAELLAMGRFYAAPQLNKIQKNLDRLSSALKCSRCGTPGPQFNCFGCETAFYCNEHCQAQHWSTHFIECSKKMPKLKKVS